MSIKETKIYQYLQDKGNTYFTEKIHTLTSIVEPIIAIIPAMFSNYTKHDIEHSVRVADYMIDLLPLDIENYSDTELAAMLYSAILHDTGMAVRETQQDLSVGKQDDIRKKHHISSEEYVNSLDSLLFFIDDSSNISIQNSIGKVVRSHGESLEWLAENLEGERQFGNDEVNFKFVASLLCLADLLDFDSRRTPLSLYDFLDLQTQSNEEWRKHFPITNYKKIEFIKDSPSTIFFEGECAEPEVYRSILQYFDYISKEVKGIKKILTNKNEKYCLKLNSEIDNRITKKGFEAADLQYQMDYLAISNLLMGESLYNDKKVALREIIQNSIDACLVRFELCKKNPVYEPMITIEYKDDTVSIKDNGIGMSLSDIHDYFLNIGHSFYNSSKFENLKCGYKPISHYGIGFLSSFMLSNEIIVKTISYQSPTICNVLELKKDSRYVILKNEKILMPDSGTEIIFNKKEFEFVFPSRSDVEKFIKSTFRIERSKVLIGNQGNKEPIIFEKKSDDKVINITEYMNNVECSYKTLEKEFHIYNADCPFIKKDSYEYLYDNTNLCDEILDSEDFDNYCKNTNNDYSISNLLFDDNKIGLLKIYPLVEGADEFYEQALDILDDESEAFEKVLESYNIKENITIYLQDKYLFYDCPDYEIINDYVIEKKYDSFGFFMDKVKSILKRNFITATSFILNTELRKVMIYDGNYALTSNNIRIQNWEKNKLFIKNVNISSFDINIPTLIDCHELFDFDINICDRNCFPDVSRSRLNPDTSAKLGYAIGRAIHIEMLKNNTNLSADQKLFLRNFIEEYYKYDATNEFCKDIEL